MRSFSVADEGPDTYKLLGKGVRGEKGRADGELLTFIICWLRVVMGVGTGKTRGREGMRVRTVPTPTSCWLRWISEAGGGVVIRVVRGGWVVGAEGAVFGGGEISRKVQG